MPVVDTSVWIEWLCDTPLGAQLAPHFAAPERCTVPTIVQLELAKWVAREVSEEAADRVIAFTQTCAIVDLDSRLALRAADLCKSRKLATADAIVYATALERGEDLITCDAHFEGLVGVVLARKGGA